MRELAVGFFRSVQVCAGIGACLCVVTVLFASFAVPLAVVVGVLEIPIQLIKGAKNG